MYKTNVLALGVYLAIVAFCVLMVSAVPVQAADPISQLALLSRMFDRQQR